MAENILAFQEGREAAISGRPRDERRSKDWLDGWDAATDVRVKKNNNA